MLQLKPDFDNVAQLPTTTKIGLSNYQLNDSKKQKMGFFGDLFKRKKGGTFFGNLVRGVASTATGGVLGSGAGLAKWQAGQEQKEYNQVLQDVQRGLANSSAYRTGAGISNNSGLSTKIQQTVYDSPQAQQLQNNQAKAWLKRNWWLILIPVVGVTVLVVVLTRGKKRRR